MLVFKERGKPEYLEKNLSEQGREPWRRAVSGAWTDKWEVREGNDGKYLPKLSDRERLETKQGNGPRRIFYRADFAHSFVS